MSSPRSPDDSGFATARFSTAFGRWVVRYRWWIIIATVPTVALSGGGLLFLTVTNDNRVFFGEQNPQYLALQALENTYSKEQNVFFVIAPRDGDVFTAHTLAAVAELTEVSWQMPYSARVESVTNFQYARSERDDLVVADLVADAEQLSDADIDAIRNVALSEPILLKHLISPSGHVTGVNVSVILPAKSTHEVTEVAAFARSVADNFQEAYPDIDIYLTGSVMMDNAFGEAAKQDMRTLVPLMLLVLTLLVGLALRSLWGTVATLAVIVLSTITGLGLAGWLGIPLNTASTAAPVLILTLAVADSVHLLATAFSLMRAGKSRNEALAQSLQVNLRAVFLTSITTVVGFLSMNFSEAPPFRDLGNIVGMGVSAAFAYSVLFLPALMAVLPVRVRSIAHKSCTGSCDWIARLVTSRRKTVLVSMCVLVGLTSFGVLRIELNDDFLAYFDGTYAFRRATDFLIENLSGWDVIEYSLDSGKPGGITRYEYLETLDRFTRWYRRQQNVIYVHSLADTMKRLNKSLHGDDDQYYQIPRQPDLAAQYLLLYELSLPFGHDLNNQINIDRSSTRMLVLLESLGTKQIRQSDQAAHRWLRNNAPDYMVTHGTGLSVVWAHITERNVRSMLGASLGALLLVSAILIFGLRSLRLAIVSVVPNLVPPLVAFGIWGLIRGQVGLALSVIVSMTIGIVVDDTVHFLSAYKRARREFGVSSSDAVRHAFHTVGTAMWVTTVALVAGFLVLTVSHYRISHDMGLMSAITIVLALLMDFLLLPTLLMTVDRDADEPTGGLQFRTETA